MAQDTHHALELTPSQATLTGRISSDLKKVTESKEGNTE
jgi:hypothetical protein